MQRPDAWWRNLIAVGIIAEDLTPLGIARYGGVDRLTASEAIAFAKDANVLVSGKVDPAIASDLIADLHPHDIARGMNDVRSLHKIDELRAHFSGTSISPKPAGEPDLAAMVTARLTAREIQVLRLIVQGMTNVEIAKTLTFSPSTICNDTTSIYAKLGVKGRPEAAAIAVDLGLIPSNFQHF